MSDVVYTSKSRLERRVGPVKVAYLPGEPSPVIFSVHGAIAEHYKVNPASLPEPHSSTLDYLVAATAACMMGTFGGALEARHIDASGGRLTAEVAGELELEQNVLVVRRINVVYKLVAPKEAQATVERVHGFYAMNCPMYRTLHTVIQIASTYILADTPTAP